MKLIARPWVPAGLGLASETEVVVRGGGGGGVLPEPAPHSSSHSDQLWKQWTRECGGLPAPLTLCLSRRRGSWRWSAAGPSMWVSVPLPGWGTSERPGRDDASLRLWGPPCHGLRVPGTLVYSASPGGSPVLPLHICHGGEQAPSQKACAVPLRGSAWGRFSQTTPSASPSPLDTPTRSARGRVPPPPPQGGLAPHGL